MTETGPLDWTISTTDIPEGGLKRVRAATEDERKRLADALELLALSDLTVSYRIEPLAKGAYRLYGHLDSALAQACVVTLEPVAAKVAANFDVEFWPTVDVPEEGEDKRILEGRDIEVLNKGEIPVGDIVFETLSASLDPYPRKPDAEFSWQDKAGENSEKANPFAVLSKLRDSS